MAGLAENSWGSFDVWGEFPPKRSLDKRLNVNQGHRFWHRSKAYIRLPISRRKLGEYCALSLEFMNLLGIYTAGVARSLCRRLLLDIVNFSECQWMTDVPNGVEKNCRKFQPANWA